MPQSDSVSTWDPGVEDRFVGSGDAMMRENVRQRVGGEEEAVVHALAVGSAALGVAVGELGTESGEQLGELVGERAHVMSSNCWRRGSSQPTTDSSPTNSTGTVSLPVRCSS